MYLSLKMLVNSSLLFTASFCDIFLILKQLTNIDLYLIIVNNYLLFFCKFIYEYLIVVFLIILLYILFTRGLSITKY